jgi:hypothetical protein
MHEHLQRLIQAIWLLVKIHLNSLNIILETNYMPPSKKKILTSLTWSYYKVLEKFNSVIKVK